MNKYIELSKDKINFAGDTEAEKKTNEMIYDLSLENDKLQQENKQLEEQNKSLRNEIKIHSKKSNNRYKAIKALENHISKLNLECQRYFDLLMIANEENQQLEEQLKIHTQPQIFIDTQDMEEQYSTDLYIDYLKTQLKQRDEVIDEISQILNKHRFEANDDYYDYSEQGICITSWNNDYDKLNDLLQKYKGDNNE